MLRLEILGEERWDERLEQFVYPNPQVLEMEHSLVSLSQWESKWNKPFLSKKEKTHEEIIDYIKCMTLTPNVDLKVYEFMSPENFKTIDNYIAASMTATTFSQDPSSKGKSEVITAEIIYHWMVSLNIPMDREKWHLNRLITLIRVCSIKNSPSKKMSARDTMARNAALNAQRRAQLNTRG